MKGKIEIKNGKILLREWKRTDAERLAIIGNNINVAKNLSDGFPFPYTLDKAKTYISSSMDKKKNLLLAIEYEGVIVGSIGASFFDDIYRINCSIAYFIGEEYWNKGIASSVIRQLCNYLFLNYEIERIYAEPFERNIGSRKALEKAGLFLEAKLVGNVIKENEVLNSCIYSCHKEAFMKKLNENKDK